MRQGRDRSRKLRVLHAPESVGGNAYGLSKALRTLGVESVMVSFTESPFKYQADRFLWTHEESRLSKWYKKFMILIDALLHFDVCHFNFGRSFLGPDLAAIETPSLSWTSRILARAKREAKDLVHLTELLAFEMFRRPIFITYQGDDARQGDYCLAHYKITFATQVESGYYSAESDRLKRRAIRRFARFCDQIYSVNPDLLNVLPNRAKFIPYSHVFMDEWLPVYSQVHDGPLKIAHAPSHRKVKGTDLILAALDRLRSQGYEFELLLVEKMSHSEARKVYERADVMVDQLFAGWYGGLAVEAMALGKPVLVYIRHEDLKHVPNEMRAELPFIEVTPATVEEGLRKVLEMPRTRLVEIARASRAFVERWHDPVKIAARVKADYEEALRRRKRID